MASNGVLFSRSDRNPERYSEPQDLRSRLVKFYQCDDLTDFEIVCRNRHWKVHRFVLALHSDVLYKACTNGFNETNEQKLDLSIHEPDHIDRLVRYLYTMKHGDAQLTPVASCRMHIEVCAIADQFNVDGLKTLAIELFEEVVSLFFESDDFFARFVKDIAVVIGRAYELQGVTDRFVRSLLEKFLKVKVLRNKGAVEAYRPVMAEHTEFALDVARLATERM